VADGDRATAYALDVVEGREVAGPHVRNACRRHLDDLAHGPGRGLVWELAWAQHIWAFFEGALKLSEGQFEGTPFRLAPSQAFKLGALNGWRRAADGTRRFRRAYVEEGKGNGKSPFAGGLGVYGLLADGEAGAQIYAAGAKKEQAAILFADAVKMIRKSPALLKRLKMSGGIGREYNVAHLATGSFFRPISKDAGKTGSGPRPHFALCDEVHEHPNRDVMEMLERGFKFRRQPLLLMITNAGSDRHSVCWEEHQHAVRVAAGTRTPDDDFTYVGEVLDDTTFAYVCALDKGDDPLKDPSCWRKANPLLGVILTEEYLAGVVAQARAMPGKLNGILRLHFCVWTDSDQAWISRETLESVLADFDPADHHGKPVNLGADLSGTRDLTAVAHVVQTGTVERFREQDGEQVAIELPTYDAWIEAWTPGDTVEERARADSAPYDLWAQQGFLRAPPGQQIRLDFVAAYLAGVSTDFVIRLLAYDRYAWRKLEEEIDALGLKIPQAEHPQGGKRRARPSEEQLEAAKRSRRDPPDGLWMPGSLNALETLILDKRIRLKINPVLISAAMSAAVERDPFDNRWFSKRKATQRIDPLVSLAMAVGAAESAESTVTSVYDQRGIRRI
jgi:phage terminase large subunit-like protein